MMDGQGDYSDTVKQALRMQFSDYEKDVIRYCAKYYGEKDTLVEIEGLPHSKELGTGIWGLVDRLSRLRLLGSPATAAHRTILPACVELVHAWDNPPLPDYRDKVTKWFWSKWWSVGIYLVVIILPASVGYIVMLKTALEWMGVIKGSSH